MSFETQFVTVKYIAGFPLLRQLVYNGQDKLRHVLWHLHR